MKTEQSTVAEKYAEAALRLSFQEGGDNLADTVLRDLHLVNGVINEYPTLEQILAHPSIAAAEKRKLIVNSFNGKVHDLTLRLLELLLDRRRLTLLRQIETEFHDLLNKHKRIVNAELICAEPLSDKAIADIKARLTEHLGKKLDVSVKVDQSLIGGVVLRLGDQVLDGSLKGKLRNLERTLLSV